MKKSILFLSFLTIFCLNITYATTYYVATNGNDTNTGTIESPWKLINQAVKKLKSGDILYVRGGTYAEMVNVNVSGTAPLPITISAYNNELPIIDGQNTLPTCDWCALVNLNGNYIHILGFEVRNTILGNHARGVTVSGHHNTIGYFNVHHIFGSGVLVLSDNSIVEDSRVWQACYENVNKDRIAWGSGLSAARFPANVIIRRNTVYNNWGEGLSTFEAQGTIIEDNIVYDNWAMNIYISDVTNVLVQRNMVYNSPSFIPRNGALHGIDLADEVSNGTTIPHSANNTIINNFLYRSSLSAFGWSLQPVGLNNVLIANNTVVDGGFSTSGATNSNSQIRNNIFISSSVSIPTNSGIAFSNNCWSKTPPANGVGTGDVIGAPLLARTGSTVPGALTADYFKLLATSPAINKAMDLTQVTQDYFETTRGSSPDIGGHEYVDPSTGISNSVSEKSFSAVYPNPINTSFTLKIPLETILKNAEMKISDVCGKEVKTISISNYETTVERGDLQSGIYLYNIVSNKESIENGKLVLQ